MSWAVVTGASGGIGLQMVKSLAAREPNIHFLLVARREEQLKSLQEELKALNVKSEYLALDLTKPESAKRIEERVRASGYAIRHLINNAGFGYYGRFGDQPLQNIEDMIALNVTTLTMLCRRLIPLMETGGRIINVASSVGFVPLGGYSVYAATKAYVISFSMALDAEIRDAREITVSAVCPGPVETEFWGRAQVGDGESFPPRLLFENPVNTAGKAIRGSARGRRVIMTGLGAWSFRFLGWLLPRRIIARSLVGKLAKEV